MALTAGLSSVLAGQGAGHPVACPRDWLWRILAGLRGLMRVSSMSGDVLS